LREGIPTYKVDHHKVVMGITAAVPTGAI
jgi:hypothetical protein